MAVAQRFWKSIGKAAFWLLIIHLVIEVSGHHYLYPTIANTILKGQLGPDIQEYSNMPNRSIAAGVPEPWPKGTGYNAASLDTEDEAYHVEFESTAFLVIKDGELLHEQYWQGFDTASLSNSFSMAKSMVGLLVGIAIDLGEIKGIDDPVYHYLPQYEEGLAGELTIRHLLTMSSGFDFTEHYLNPFAFPARANYGDNLEALMRRYEVTDQPGHTFVYQSGNTQLLAMILQSATRTPLARYASTHVWKRIGAESEALWSLDSEDGNEKAFCCINATARDFARLGKLYLDFGSWNGERIVDSAFVAQSIVAADLMNPDGSPNEVYGMHWWIGSDEELEFFMMRGIKGQYVIVVPEENMIVVRLGRKRDLSGNRQHPNDVYQYIRMATKLLQDEG